ncbi:MAG: sugar ABC transporter permease [Planctomycetes bacterium]|nr:sugar ABC transporter permease [Planctomycetota bacterium]
MTDRSKHNWRGYALIAPAAIYLAVFALAPIVFAGWMSLHRWHLLKPERPFVGLANFITLAQDPFFRNAVWNTLVFVAVGVPLSVVSSLLVAALVSQPLRGVGLFRTVFYVPAVCSQVAISMVWTWILMPTNGLANSILAGWNALLDGVHVQGLHFATDTNFLERPGFAMASLVAMFMWIGLGPRMIIFVAGIQNIPETLYEAAVLDGCTTWRKFRHVTLPLLLPTTLFVLVTTTIAAFQIFTPVFMLTRGGPQRSTDVVLYHIYAEAWQKLEAGMASAMSFVLLAMILVVSAAQFRMLRHGDGEEAAE